MKELCEVWSDEELDKFLEENKREKFGLTVYPSKEWGEKVEREFIKRLT